MSVPFLAPVGHLRRGRRHAVGRDGGEVAVVVAQNGAWRLKPKVMLILDKDKNMRTEFVVTDLASDAEQAGPKIWITKEHPANAFGIDPGKFFL